MSTVREFVGDSDELREAWLKTDKDTWAEVGGLAITGELRERDSGVTFVKLIAELDETELINLRYQLSDAFFTDAEWDERDGIERTARHLVEVVEAELGGRWVS